MSHHENQHIVLGEFQGVCGSVICIVGMRCADWRELFDQTGETTYVRWFALGALNWYTIYVSPGFCRFFTLKVTWVVCGNETNASDKISHRDKCFPHPSILNAVRVCIWCHSKTALDGTSDENPLWFICVPLYRRGIWCVIRGYPKNENGAPRDEPKNGRGRGWAVL